MEFQEYRTEVKRLVSEEIDLSGLKATPMSLVEMVIVHSFHNRKKAPTVAKRLLRSLKKYGRKE